MALFIALMGKFPFHVVSLSKLLQWNWWIWYRFLLVLRSSFCTDHKYSTYNLRCFYGSPPGFTYINFTKAHQQVFPVIDVVCLTQCPDRRCDNLYPRLWHTSSYCDCSLNNLQVLKESYHQGVWGNHIDTQHMYQHKCNNTRANEMLLYNKLLIKYSVRAQC